MDDRCEYPECQENRFSYRLYCQKHRCQYNALCSGRIDGSSGFCKLHTCVKKGCSYSLRCPEHSCKGAGTEGGFPLCPKLRRADSDYCNDCRCKFCTTADVHCKEHRHTCPICCKITLQSLKCGDCVCKAPQCQLLRLDRKKGSFCVLHVHRCPDCLQIPQKTSFNQAPYYCKDHFRCTLVSCKRPRRPRNALCENHHWRIRSKYLDSNTDVCTYEPFVRKALQPLPADLLPSVIAFL